LIALDAATGDLAWEIQGADPERHESFVAAPIAWKGRVFIGIATSELGIRGHLMAFDAKSGQELWRFYTIPLADEKGGDSWDNQPPSETSIPGGGGFWSTFSLDPATGEVFGPVANPSPDYTPNMRPGANLYTNSVISLNAATGELNWYYQAIAHDEHDWDLGTAPSLYRTKSGKDMLAVAGKNGRVYGIDRNTKSAVFNTPAITIANDGPIEETPNLVCPGTI
jgi:alcohol dehydrogenase (cytochrome c)